MPLKPFKAPGARLALRSKPASQYFSAGAGEAEVILDISRLLSRSFHAAPTGIDRVEYVYARELLERMPDRLAFAAVHPAGGYYGRLNAAAVRQFLAFTAARWRNSKVKDEAASRAAVIRHLIALRPRPVPRATRPRVYLQVSPHHLDDADQVGAILRAEGARFVTLVHDVIPLTHPEFARPQGAQEHLRRVRTIDRYAHGIIGNSQATLDSLADYARDTGQAEPPAIAAWLGATPLPGRGTPAATPSHPTFVILGTIEARKNHLTLLHVWTRLAERLRHAAPKLLIIGQRGWFGTSPSSTNRKVSGLLCLRCLSTFRSL